MKIVKKIFFAYNYIFLAVYVTVFFFSIFNKKSSVLHVYPQYMFEPNNKLFCLLPANLGTVKVDLTNNYEENETMSENKELQPGGIWFPKNCKSWQRLAIIIPYRDRREHLLRLLHRLHPMLQRQMIHYQIFVIEQTGVGKFNRGKLLNIGVVEAIKETKKKRTNTKIFGEKENFDCFLFHDVDLLPEDDRNIYHCTSHVHHLITALDETRYHIMYYNYLGGVLSVNKDNYFLTNGHSNSYWGWGNEDDDYNARSQEVGLFLTRPLQHIGRYKMVKHQKLWRESSNNDMFLSWKIRWQNDGVGQLVEVKNMTVIGDEVHNKTVNNNNAYKVDEIVLKPLYTHIKVDAGKEPKEIPKIDDSVPRVSMWWFLNYYFP